MLPLRILHYLDWPRWTEHRPYQYRPDLPSEEPRLSRDLLVLLLLLYAACPEQVHGLRVGQCTAWMERGTVSSLGTAPSRHTTTTPVELVDQLGLPRAYA